MNASPATKRPGSVAALAEPVSKPSPTKGKLTVMDTTTDPQGARVTLTRAAVSIDTVQSLIHAAWMAAGKLDPDDCPAERDALQTVLHIAGERLCEAGIAVESALLQGGVQS